MLHLPSGPELVFIFGLALIIFGPKKLPEIGKTIGQGLRELRKASREITDAFDISDITNSLPRVSDFLSGDEPEPHRAPDPVLDTDLDSQKENDNNATNRVGREPDGMGSDRLDSDPAVRSEEVAGDRQVDG